jgi:hypothetical protein
MEGVGKGSLSKGDADKELDAFDFKIEEEEE